MANWFVAFKVSPGSWFKPLISKLAVDAENYNSLRFFHEDDLHITVAFLGSLKTDDVAKVTDVLKTVVFSPVMLKADRLIALPSERRFSAICLDFAADEIFIKQMEAWRESFFNIVPLAKDQRKFLAHTTIARPARNLSSGSRQRLLEKIKSLQNLNIRVKAETLAFYTWADDRGTSSLSRQFKVVWKRKF